MTPEQFAIDPEVAAELAAEAREVKRRAAQAAREISTAEQSTAEQWPCRDCGASVAMTLHAIELVRASNRALVAMRAQPLSKREAALCDGCLAKAKAASVAAERRRKESIAALTAELRHGTFPARELAVIRELRGLGADIEDIGRRIAKERATAKTPTRTKL